MKPGEIILSSEDIELNEGLETRTLSVENKAAYPIAVTSHYHFFEANRCLSFDREKAWGMRLSLPSGSWICFKPSERRQVELVPFRGARFLTGLNGLTEGPLDGRNQKECAMERAKDLGYWDGGGES